MSDFIKVSKDFFKQPIENNNTADDINFSQEEITNIVNLFNSDYQEATKKISELAQKYKVEPEKVIAEFLFYENDRIKDKSIISHYLGKSGKEADQHKKVLGHFTQIMQNSFKEKDFVNNLNIFLSKIALLQDEIKMGNLLESFATAILEKDRIEFRKEGGDKEKENEESTKKIQDLAISCLGLSINLHTKSVKEKTSLKDFLNKNEGLVLSQNLHTIYDKIKSTPLMYSISEVEPNYAFLPLTSEQEVIFKSLNNYLKTSDTKELHHVFPHLDETLKISVDKSKTSLSKLIGYEGSINIKDRENKPLVNIEIYVPNILSKILFGKKARVNIKTVELSEAKKDDLENWAKISQQYSEKYKEHAEGLTKGLFDELVKNEYYETPIVIEKKVRNQISKNSSKTIKSERLTEIRNANNLKDYTKIEAEQQKWKNIAEKAENDLNNEKARVEFANRVATLIASSFNVKSKGFVEKVKNERNGKGGDNTHAH